MPKNILVISFDRNNIVDYYQIFNTLCDKQTTVEILTDYSQNTNVKLFKNIKNIHFINSKKITTLTSNPLFSPAFPLNDLLKTLTPLKDRSWDKVINLDRSLSSQIITSYLSSPNTYLGLKSDNGRDSIFSSDTSKIWNSSNIFPTPEIRAALMMCEVKGPIQSIDGLQISEKHNISANRNIQSLRKQKNNEIASSVKVIGIDLINLSKFLPESEIVQLLKTILKTEQFYPLILIKPGEKDMFNHINHLLDNKLVAAEVDHIATPSLIINLDGLIAPNSFQSVLADAVRCPQIQVIDKFDVIKPQSSITSNLVSFARIEDILFSLHHLFSLEHNHIIKSFVGEIVYKNNIVMIKNLSNKFVNGVNFHNLFNKYISYKYLHNSEQFNKEMTTAQIELEKEFIYEAFGSILALLRLLNQSSSTATEKKNIITHFDKLFQMSSTTNVLSAVPLTIFKENISAFAGKHIRTEITKELYTLKNELKEIIKICHSKHSPLRTQQEGLSI